MPKRRVTVPAPQDPETPVTVDVMAEAIVRISDGMQAVLAAGLTKRALMLLIYDRLNGVPLGNIEAVLNTIPELKNYYLTKEGRDKVTARTKAKA